VAKTQGVTLLIDECGFSTQPTVRRTWAARGQTPVLMQQGSWHKLSVIGALSLRPSGRVNEQFCILRRNATVMDFVLFLEDCRRRYRCPLTVVWDNLPRHGQVEKLFAGLGLRWCRFERLPAYAPELNPVETLWSSAKAGTLANFAPAGVDELEPQVHRTLSQAKSRQTVLQGCFRSAGLAI
jgi:hypothetical protein